MNKHSKLEKYSELFRKNIGKYLTPGVSIKTTIYPVEQEGAVFEFILNKEDDSTEIIEKTFRTVGSVLSSIPQRLIGGQIEGVRFAGTNLALEGNRILVIKGENASKHWTGDAVIADVERVVSTSLGSRKQ